jgi:hypothetical protein
MQHIQLVKGLSSSSPKVHTREREREKRGPPERADLPELLLELVATDL